MGSKIDRLLANQPPLTGALVTGFLNTRPSLRAQVEEYLTGLNADGVTEELIDEVTVRVRELYAEAPWWI